MRIDSIHPLPLRWGRARVGVNVQIVAPLTSILSPVLPERLRAGRHQGERRYFAGVFSEQ